MASGEPKGYQSRLANIRTLKEKVIELQNELRRIEKAETSPMVRDRSRSPRINAQSKYNTIATSINPVNPTQSPKFRNPNFWGSNPILGVPNYQSQSPPSRKSPVRRSPSKPRDEEVLGIMRQASRVFYQRKDDIPEKQAFSQTWHSLKPPVNKSKENLQGPNPECFSNHCSLKVLDRLPLDKINNRKSQSPDRNTPRFKKVSAIKTFVQRNVDPILRPPTEKKTQRKICRDRNQSPQNLLTEHDKSNTRMYLTPSKTPIFLSPQNRTCIKNRSDIVRDLLNQTLNEKSNVAQQKTGKKHFARHFNETLRNQVYL